MLEKTTTDPMITLPGGALLLEGICFHPAGYFSRYFFILLEISVGEHMHQQRLSVTLTFS